MGVFTFHFVWYLPHFGIFTFHFAWDLLLCGRVPLPFCMGLATFGHVHLPFCMGFPTCGRVHLPFCIGFATCGRAHLPFCMGFATCWHVHLPFCMGFSTCEHVHHIIMPTPRDLIHFGMATFTNYIIMSPPSCQENVSSQKCKLRTMVMVRIHTIMFTRSSCQPQLMYLRAWVLILI